MACGVPTADDLRDTRALVTGGAGVIGRELIERLAARGARVLCCDLKPRPADLDARVEYIEGDANHLTPGPLQAFAPSVCFHLAATFERSVESEGFWRESYWHNVRLSHHLLELLSELRSLRRVVFASSYLIYDPAAYAFELPRSAPRRLREDLPVSPRNVCGASKYFHERELASVASAPGCRFTAVSARIFRVYGKDSRDVVSRWVRLLLDDPEAELEVYRPEGWFDYVYAADVAEGLLRLASSRFAGVVNLGSGKARRVQELIELLRARFPGLRVRAIESDIAYEAHEADTGLLQAATDGWRPTTALERGVELLVEHYSGAAQRPARESARPLHVLVTSASRKVALVRSFRRALAVCDPRGRVWAADSDELCVARVFADRFWAMPRLDQLRAEDLAAFCAEHGIRLIVPTRDAELERFAELREPLAAAGVVVSGSDVEAVRACLDKLAFFERCAKEGLPAIPTTSSLEELDALAPDTRCYAVKERRGAGARAVGLALDRDAAARHARNLTAPLFQPFVAGQEYSVDTYVTRSGEPVDAVVRTRLRVHAGESVVTETCEDAELAELVVELVQRFEIRGHAVVQIIRRAEDGAPFLVECNPRIGGASALAFEAGLDSARLALLEAAGLHVSPAPGTYRRGLRMLRAPADYFEAR